jgi:hypothetical protein
MLEYLIIILLLSFKSPKDPHAIEYKKFCVEVESIFADDQLEKNPLIDAKQYVLERNITQNYLTADAEDMVVNGLKKIAERVSFYSKNVYVYCRINFIIVL